MGATCLGHNSVLITRAGRPIRSQILPAPGFRVIDLVAEHMNDYGDEKQISRYPTHFVAETFPKQRRRKSSSVSFCARSGSGKSSSSFSTLPC